MHELSIAYNLVEIGVSAATSAGLRHVDKVNLRLGALSGVVSDALLFGYDIATAGTVLEGSKLVIEEIPVAVYCPACDAISTLPTIQLLVCPLCGQPTGDIRQGRELELVSLEVEERTSDERTPNP